MSANNEFYVQCCKAERNQKSKPTDSKPYTANLYSVDPELVW